MLGFIKISILSIVLLGMFGCTGGESSGQENIRKSIRINTFGNDEKGVYVYYSKGYPGNNIKMLALEHNASQWIYKELDTSILDTSTITYTKEKVIVKEKNTVIFEDTLADISKIEETLGFTLYDYTLKYTPFRVVKNFSWDRKTHIISIGVDKYSQGCNAIEPCFKTMYYLSAIKEDDNWNVKLIHKDNDTISMNDWHMMQVKKHIFLTHFDADYGDQNVKRKSTDESKAFYFNGFYFRKINSNIVRIKNEDVRHQEDVQVIESFWHRESRHVFKDLGHFDKDRGKYILYEMYTKENPTTPINQQKIYWETK